LYREGRIAGYVTEARRSKEKHIETQQSKVIPLFTISTRGNLKVFGDPEHPLRTLSGWTIISLFESETPTQTKEKNEIS
jgi:hypothetical protein